jgi:hypothetical protein
MAIKKLLVLFYILSMIIAFGGPKDVLAVVDGGTAPSIPVGECRYIESGKKVECNVAILTGAYPKLSRTGLTTTKATYESGAYSQGAYIYKYKIVTTKADKDSGKLTQTRFVEATGRSSSTTTTVKVTGTPPTFPAPTTPTPTPDPDPDPDTETTTPTEPVEIGFGEIVDVDTDLSSTKGCGADGKYSSGILKGVSCTGATKTKEEVVQIIKNIIEDFLLPTVGVIFVTVIVLGGLVYITSGGNEESVKRGKKILTSGIIGFLIVTLSYTLIRIFVAILGGNIV